MAISAAGETRLRLSACWGVDIDWALYPKDIKEVNIISCFMVIRMTALIGTTKTNLVCACAKSVVSDTHHYLYCTV